MIEAALFFLGLIIGLRWLGAVNAAVSDAPDDHRGLDEEFAVERSDTTVGSFRNTPISDHVVLTNRHTGKRRSYVFDGIINNYENHSEIQLFDDSTLEHVIIRPGIIYRHKEE